MTFFFKLFIYLWGRGSARAQGHEVDLSAEREEVGDRLLAGAR